MARKSKENRNIVTVTNINKKYPLLVRVPIPIYINRYFGLKRGDLVDVLYLQRSDSIIIKKHERSDDGST